jgi:hypothetical protein
VTYINSNSGSVNWNAGVGAATYQVRYCSSVNNTGANSACTMGAWIPVAGTSYTPPAFTTANRWVRFEVQGLSAANVASASALTSKVQLILPPSPPTNVAARNGTVTTPTNTVTAGVNFGNVTGATSYNIRWATNSAMTGTTTTISGVTSNTQYVMAGVNAANAINVYLQVQAVNGGGAGAWSSAVGVIAR